MKQKFRIHIFLIVLLVLLGGCRQEETFPRIAAAGKGVTVNYSFDDLQTRSIAATPAEKKVDKVYFIFYNSSTGAYVAWQGASVPAGSGATGSFSLSIPGALTAGSKYRTLIVANYDNYKADGKSFEDYIRANNSKSYDEMRRVMKSQSPAKARVAVPLPLYGTLLGQDGEESLFTPPSPDSTEPLNVSVRFSRAVSRFDLHNLAANRLLISWVKVCNYRDAGYFFHQDAPLGDAVEKGTATTLPDLSNPPAGYVKVAPPLPDTNRQDIADGGLYAYPNIASYATQDDERTTCLLIAGYYQDPATGTPNTEKLTYYRANVADNGLSQVLKRNYAYTVVINSVKREGAETEDQAMSEKDRLLDYVVDDEWEQDNNNTVVDDKGNFLTVSRASVVLNGHANESAVIKVSVKEGLGWNLAWRENVGNNFKFEKIDDSSFRIVTTNDNNTVFVNTAQLEVEATGITPTPAKPLKATINITQLSATGEPEILSVEGQTGTLEMSVPGQGTTLSLQVLTGGANGSWTTSPDNALLSFIGADYTQFGGNKGRIQIQFQPNVSDAPRSGTLTVTRSPEGSNVPDVKIHFTQEPSKYLVTVFPNYGNEPLVVNGFSNDAGNPDGVIKVIPFSVKLVDPENYTFKVESGFREDVDAFLTLTTPQNETQPRQATYTDSSAGTTLTGGSDGQMFYLNIFRTGPGDVPITKSIKVTAVNKKNEQPVTERQFTFTVTIETNCRNDDVDLKDLKITVADRNYGAQLKQTSTAKNYANQANHPDHANTLFRGGLFAFDTAKLEEACADYGQFNYEEAAMKQGWRPPSNNEQENLKPLVRFSKQRAFIASRDAAGSGYVGCWLPTSGDSTKDGATKTSGFFWSGTPYNGNGYYMGVHAETRAAGTGSNYSYLKYSLRCVRTIPTPPTR